MANGVAEEWWHTELTCEKEHRFSVDIKFFAPVVEEQDRPEPDRWQPDIAGITCPYGDSPVEVVRRLYRVD
jgi:hypothetical protein